LKDEDVMGKALIVLRSPNFEEKGQKTSEN
jgi:hypothetical protein